MRERRSAEIACGACDPSPENSEKIGATHQWQDSAFVGHAFGKPDGKMP